MTLTDFLSALINKGEVTVAPIPAPFDDEDKRLALIHLQQYYEDDCTDMPAIVPEYNAEAALWAACYIYRTIQFILLRNLGEAEISAWLQPYTGPQTASAAYAVDLTFRYLPDLFHLAQGLSPEDPLVKEMAATAAKWPFSAAAIPSVITDDLSLILEHDALRIAYTDRIMLAKDITKCTHPSILPFVKEALGAHSAILWPQFEIDLTVHS